MLSLHHCNCLYLYSDQTSLIYHCRYISDQILLLLTSLQLCLYHYWDQTSLIYHWDQMLSLYHCNCLYLYSDQTSLIYHWDQMLSLYHCNCLYLYSDQTSLIYHCRYISDQILLLLASLQLCLYHYCNQTSLIYHWDQMLTLYHCNCLYHYCNQTSLTHHCRYINIRAVHQIVLLHTSLHLRLY